MKKTVCVIEINPAMSIRKKQLRIRWRDLLEQGIRYYETKQKGMVKHGEK